MHVLKASFPTYHLAPWMSIHKKQRLVVVSRQSIYGSIGKELARQTGFWTDGEKREAEESKKGGLVLHDAAEAFSYFLGLYGQGSHDFAPSLDGLGRRQAIGIGSAQKTGVYAEPKARSLRDKLTGKNKAANQVSGGA